MFSRTKKVEMKKIYYIICGKYRKFKNPKISYVFKKQFVLLFAVSTSKKMKKYLKMKNRSRY